MKVAFYSAKSYEQDYFSKHNQALNHEISFFDTSLNSETARLAEDHDAVCAFVNDNLDRACLEALAKLGVKAIALRSAGYNHVDIQASKDLGLAVCYVPAYSPYSVAEHTFALMLSLNRKIHKAYNRVRDLNFSLDHLMGHELHGKTIGLFGLGRIGLGVAQIAKGMGMTILAVDPFLSKSDVEQYGVQLVEKDALLKMSDVVTLHCPLTPDTHHMLDKAAFALMKSHAMLINTSRGGLIDHQSLIEALKKDRLSAVGLDVYEQEQGVFFSDHSDEVLNDDILARLLTFPNVIVTSHQGFFTHEAMTNISQTTLQNLSQIETGQICPNTISL